MNKALLAMALFAVTAFGADVSGKWSGTFSFQNNDGDQKTIHIVMDAKQEGSKLTGTIGPEGADAGPAAPIQGGTVEGNKIRFEVQPEGHDSPMKFDLTVDGDRMTGQIKGEDDGHPREAKVELKKAS